MTRCLHLLSICLLFAAIAGCCDECPTCPTEETRRPYAGWLYFVDETAWSYDLYKVDTETDSIVDSLRNSGGYIPGNIAATTDGKYLAVGYHELSGSEVKTSILDAQTLDLVAELPDIGSYFFDERDDLLLIARGGLLSVYDVPNFSKVFTDTTSPINGREIDREANWLYCTSEFGLPVVIYDYLQHQIVDSFYISPSVDDTV